MEVNKYQYNNREFHETDLRRYINMEFGSNFYGKTEMEIFNLLSKEALIVVILQMIKETTCHIAMYAGCPCHGKMTT